MAAQRDLSDRRHPHLGYQPVLNEVWPPDQATQRSRPYPAEHQLKVTVRVHWQVDGWQDGVPATAIFWTQHHVKVWCSDPRLRVPYIWLVPSDVHRVTG